MKAHLIKSIDLTCKIIINSQHLAVELQCIRKHYKSQLWLVSLESQIKTNSDDEKFFFHFKHKSFRRFHIIHRKIKHLHTRSVVFADVLLPELRHFIESDPCLSLLYVLQLFHDFFFSDSVPFCNSPKLSEFVEWYLAISVKVNLIKEFTRWQFSERTLPMLECLVTIYLLATVLIKYFECPVNFL